MGKRISTFPRLPCHLQTVTLGDVVVRLRLTWRHRTQAWYLDIYDASGTALLLGRRLSAGWSPNAGLVLDGGPDGYLFARGADGYGRMDLGNGLYLQYLTRAEVQAAGESEAPAVVVTL